MPGEPKERARAAARELARAALARGEPLAWFEEVYAARDEALIPWAELVANPSLVAWVDRERLTGQGRRALTIGAGLGDDAELLARLGFEVAAFDVAPSAVAFARDRFPLSTVDYRVADVLALPAAWQGAFDFVLESYTLQALPPSLRARAASGISATIAPGGSLLVISSGRDESEPEGGPPWPLTPDELQGLFEPDLEGASFEDYVDDEDPPVRRLRATFRRP